MSIKRPIVTVKPTKKGLLVPLEGKPTQYIKPDGQKVQYTPYYRRCVDRHGDLEIIQVKNKSKKSKEVVK